MKKILTLALALLAFAQIGFAQVSAMNIGYVDGAYKGTGTSGFSTTEKNTWVSGAIYVPASRLNLLAGNHIDSIHAALASRINIDSLRVWVRTDLNGADLASGGISGKSGAKPRAAKGWNTIGLDQPYTIKKNEGLYIGYSFLQKSTSTGLSILSRPQANALFVKMGTDAQWEDRSDQGALAVEAFVYGDNLPKYNLALLSLTAQPTYVVDKGELSLTAQIKNLATATITGYDMSCTIDGSNDTFVAHIDSAIAYNETQYITFNISPTTAITSDDPAHRIVTATITNLKEGQDEDITDNADTASFAVIPHDYERHVLIEEFTTEQCPNCPRVAAQLHAALENPAIAGRTHAICHHSGYYTDWLSQPCDNPYLWFYNMGGQTFAPALLIDRATRDYISNQADGSPIFMPASGSTTAGADNIVNVVEQRWKEPAQVYLNISASIDSVNAKIVHITVSGERSSENFTVNPARINVFLYEDSIAPHSQASASADFKHMHVERAYNSVWGDVLTWDGNSYTYSCDLNLRDSYDRNHLGIVAWIWDYDEDDVTKCEIENSNAITWDKVKVNQATGINTLRPTTATTAPEYYSIDGCRLSEAPQKGIFILRQNGKSIKVIK